MFAHLSVNGESLDTVAPIHTDDDTTIRVELAADGGGPFHRCLACGDDLAEEPDRFTGEITGEQCPDYDHDTEDHDGDAPDHGPHTPEVVALSWCNSARISLDPDEDAVTVSVSVGSPLGAFCFTVRRVPDDACGALAGALIVHMPYPGESSPHEPLTQIHPGTFLIGRTPRGIAPGAQTAPDARAAD
jgi:hypothetical protein